MYICIYVYNLYLFSLLIEHPRIQANTPADVTILADTGKGVTLTDITERVRNVKHLFAVMSEKINKLVRT